MAKRASRRCRRPSRGLGGGVLRVDGLTDGGEAAAQQLLGHGNLLGAQRRQHGVAVHGRGRRDGSLASGRPPVALARTAMPGPARPGAPRRRPPPGHRHGAAARRATAGPPCAVAAGSATRAIATVATAARPALIAVVAVLVTSTASLA